MKISKKVHLYILTTLVIISAGAVPAAIIGYFFSFDVTVQWFNNEVPINMLVFSWLIFAASFMRKQIYARLDEFIYSNEQKG